ncbi:hypothetical protein H9Y04_25635 [Streptomyces sp. TRM66268-LWL]|uniref:Phosphatidate cytidylyltransferase n=1 Tax=Streptomyces polyasparticus TaxID=2767826 RepID=A0ABR7SKH3_9ACTN|nr:hypothetical protein [Streptomyces polyasparticus]MBC9715927.1 hypothetical protein [Streptomyces polyasparticus]
MTALILVAAAVLGAVLVFGTGGHVVGWALIIAALIGLMTPVDRERFRH